MTRSKRHPLDHDGDGRKGGSLPKQSASPPPAEPSLTAEQVRAIVREELPKAGEDPRPPAEPSLTAEQVRAIVREELRRGVFPSALRPGA